MLRTMSTSNLARVLWVGLHFHFLSSSFLSSFLLFLFSVPYFLSAADVDARGIGGGLWHPEADPLALLREDIDENSQRWKDVLRAPELRREFLNGASDDDKAIVDAFAHRNRDSALKTKPKVCSMLSILLSARNQPPPGPTDRPSDYHCARSDRQHSMLFVMEGPGGYSCRDRGRRRHLSPDWTTH